VCRQGPGISSEIETAMPYAQDHDIALVARGLASHLRLKLPTLATPSHAKTCRQGPGISSEIETATAVDARQKHHSVARGLASHLRLKYNHMQVNRKDKARRQGPGISSEIEILLSMSLALLQSGRQGPGISSEIEIFKLDFCSRLQSPVARGLASHLRLKSLFFLILYFFPL